MLAVAPPEDAPGRGASEPIQSAVAEEPPAAGLELTATARDDLLAYRELLATWNTRMNLVGPSALDQFWSRHVADSAQLLELVPEARTFADLGSGAGFPGLVLAILLKPRAGAHVHLVESLGKRCRFLEAVSQALELPVSVHQTRAEALASPPKVEVVTARACAPLERLLGYARPTLRPGVRGLFLKGRTAAEEVEAARRLWRFRAVLHPSRTDPEARVVEVTELRRG